MWCAIREFFANFMIFVQNVIGAGFHSIWMFKVFPNFLHPFELVRILCSFFSEIVWRKIDFSRKFSSELHRSQRQHDTARIQWILIHRLLYLYSIRHSIHSNFMWISDIHLLACFCLGQVPIWGFRYHFILSNVIRTISYIYCVGDSLAAVNIDKKKNVISLSLTNSITFTFSSRCS